MRSTRIFSLGLIAVMLLSGCSNIFDKESNLNNTRSDIEIKTNVSLKDIDYSDTYVSGQDSQEYLYGFNATGVGETDNSIFLSSITTDFIYVLDKETLNYKLLCDKPDCLHDEESDPKKKEDCRAYTGGKDSFVYYGNRLYYNNMGEYKDPDGNKGITENIYSVKTDGSDKRLIFSIKDISLLWFKVHRGYIYYMTTSFDREGIAMGKAALYRIPLDGKEKDSEELIPFYNYGRIWENYNVYDAQFYGNFLYINMFYMPSDSDESHNAEEKLYEIKYNLETGEWVDLNEKVEHEIFNPNFVGGKIVYCDYVDGAKTQDVYECGLNGENEHKVLTVDSCNSQLAFDGKHFISMVSVYEDEENPSPTITYYDQNYDVVGVYEVPFDVGMAQVIGENIIEFKKIDEEKGKLNEIYLVDVSNYSEGDMLKPQLVYKTNLKN